MVMNACLLVRLVPKSAAVQGPLATPMRASTSLYEANSWRTAAWSSLGPTRALPTGNRPLNRSFVSVVSMSEATPVYLGARGARAPGVNPDARALAFGVLASVDLKVPDRS